MKTAYDERGIPYLIEAAGSEAEHVIDLLHAQAERWRAMTLEIILREGKSENQKNRSAKGGDAQGKVDAFVQGWGQVALPLRVRHTAEHFGAQPCAGYEPKLRLPAPGKACGI